MTCQEGSQKSNGNKTNAKKCRESLTVPTNDTKKRKIATNQIQNAREHCYRRGRQGREITSVAILVEKEEHFTVLYKSLLFCVGCYSCVSVLRPVLSLCDVCTINKQ